MERLQLDKGMIKQWRLLVSESAVVAGCDLDKGLENYLATLLMRFVDYPQLATDILLTERFINAGNDFSGMRNKGKHQIHQTLRNVGDKCLLVSGLFPQLASQRHVKVSYFVNLGRAAYMQLQGGLSNAAVSNLYCAVSHNFVALMDVLQTIRQAGTGVPGIDHLQAYDLWHDTNSRYARSVLRMSTDAQPVRVHGAANSIRILH